MQRKAAERSAEYILSRLYIKFYATPSGNVIISERFTSANESFHCVRSLADKRYIKSLSQVPTFNLLFLSHLFKRVAETEKMCSQFCYSFVAFIQSAVLHTILRFSRI